MAANQKAYPTQNLKTITALEGGRAYKHTFAFSANASEAINKSFEDIGLSCCKCVFVDNSDNGSTAYLTVTGTGQVISAPAYSQGFYPILSVGLNLQVEGTSAGAVDVDCQFLNFELPFSVWQVQAPAAGGTTTVNGTVTAAPVVSTFTSRNGTITVGGTSQTLAAANGTRKRIIIQNPVSATAQGIAAAESLFINFTTAAGVSDGTSFELLPGGIFDTGNGPVTSELITVNAATTGHKFVAKEM